ncbi:MAG: hypothetical protein IJF14_05575 [Clostridia bacterium]|nr:hypothetical protein [Clostridia bacterium]
MFKAGFSRVDITPPLGSNLAGYFSKRPADGILDPLYLNALAINDGKQTNIIITSDFLSVMEVFATKIRGMVSQRTGVPADNIMITALHQHTSIRIGCWPWTGSMEDENYLTILYAKYCDVAQMAIADMEEAEVCTAIGETDEKIAFIRRYKMKDGSTKTNPGRLNPEIDHPIGNADNNVRLIRFKRKDNKDIAFVNFADHPDVIGGTKISADWPGFVRKYTEQDIPNARCIILNGAQGDINHVNTGIAEEQMGHDWCNHMGRVIADTVVKLWDKTEKHEDTELYSEIKMVYIPTNTLGMDNREELLEYQRKYDAGELGDDVDIAKLAAAGRMADLPMMTICQKVPVTVMGIGDIALVGFGGEPFTEYAEFSRAAAPELMVITCGLANGQQGYLPSVQAFAEGGYEASNSRFSSEGPTMLQSAAKELLDKHNKYKK